MVGASGGGGGGGGGGSGCKSVVVFSLVDDITLAGSPDLSTTETKKNECFFCERETKKLAQAIYRSCLSPVHVQYILIDIFHE